MDNELKAKVDEILKNKDVEKLSKDDLDNVSGGTFSFDPNIEMCCVNGKMMSAKEFNTLIFSIAQTSGYTIARDMLNSLTGYACSEMSKTYNWGSDKSDMDKMVIVMNRFWANYSGYSKY